MIATSFSICKDCAHISYCVLTDQKDKVWSCSDYDNALNVYESEQDSYQSNNLIIND